MAFSKDSSANGCEGSGSVVITIENEVRIQKVYDECGNFLYEIREAVKVPRGD